MVVVRKLADVLKENPDYKPSWDVLEETLYNGIKIATGMENPRFGKIERIVICDDSGKPLFDQYRIEEGPEGQCGKRKPSQGAVIVPYFYKDGELYVGLIKRTREVAINPGIGRQGEAWTELPRGFGKIDDLSDEETARRELGEETRKVAKNIKEIGMGNPNNAFYVTYVRRFAVEVDPEIESYLKPDSKEPILKCEFHPYASVRRMVAERKIYDDWTLSTLMMFDVLIKQ